MNWKNILFGVLITVLGIVIVVNPEMSIQVSVVLLGAVLLINGILNLIKVLKLSNDELFKKVVLIRNVASIVVGILAVTMPFIFSNAIKVIVGILLYVLAIYLIAGAVAQIIVVGRLKQEGKDVSYFTTEIIASIITAVLLILLAAHFATIIVRILGAVFIVCGVIYIILNIKNKTLVITPDEVRDIDDSKTDE